MRGKRNGQPPIKREEGLSMGSTWVASLLQRSKTPSSRAFSTL
jgi:hypothetical protein